MKKNKTTFKKKKSLKDQYLEIIKFPHPLTTRQENESLEQPHLYKFVDTVTTYGPYEKPI